MTALRGAIALAVLLGCGCASVGTGTAAVGGEATGEPDRPGAGRLTRARTRVAAGQNGLEVCQWQVVDDPWRIADALRAHAAPAVAGTDELALRRNGFVVSAVRAGDLEQLQRDLGGSAQDVRTWMGIAPAWRELVAAPLGDVMLEIDGVARERPGGTVRLMARSWPLPMEDGGRIAVEAVPQVVTNALQASLVRNGERLAGEVIGSCAMELELDRDVAWVITCDPSTVVEPREPDAVPTEAPAPPGTAEPGEPPAATGTATGTPAAPSAPSAPAAPPAPPAAQRVPPAGVAPAAPAPAPAKARKPDAPPPLDAPSRTPSAALLAAALASGPPSTSGKSLPRIATLGASLLLASPERAGVPGRRTVLVLIPHLDAMPFPDDGHPKPMTGEPPAAQGTTP
jgi:hypothetical protein